MALFVFTTTPFCNSRRRLVLSAMSTCTYHFFLDINQLIFPYLQTTLIKNLQLQLEEFDKKLNKREVEVRRKERLAYVGISLDNVLPAKDDKKLKQKQVADSEESESNSESSVSSETDSDEPIYQLRQRRQAHSYRFNDYDDLINSAIQVSYVFIN